MQHKPYLSQQLTKTVEVPKGTTKEVLYPYFADEELKKAVNLALLLNRPLLLMGEPGSGKSLLAKAVAYEWYEADMYNKSKYFEWNVKSSSKAREGFYEFDHLLRLRDATYKGADEKINLESFDRYRKYGPMAEAMRNSAEEEKAVLLIDEIDKADIDFANDLLIELERNSFNIPETNESFQYDVKTRPFIVITSNGEKDLSDAFLRRCIYHYIDMFSINKIESDSTRIWLNTIISSRFYDQEAKDDKLLEKAVSTFLQLRKRMTIDAATYKKTVSTSEFIDWFDVLKRCSKKNAPDESLNNDREMTEWMQGVTDSNNKLKVPFGNVLFKTTASLFDFKSVEKPAKFDETLSPVLT